MALVADTPLISTLVMGLSIAFISGMAASKLRLSPIVGYLLAGIIIGPFTPGFTGDVHVASQLAEIGIVLLMFGVGLHFSFKDLMRVKNIALPGAIGQIGAATLLGMGVAHWWGWSMSSGILFGLALSVASTVVLLRALEERHALHSIDGHIAVGWLIVEDLAIVLALVLIPALAPNAGAAVEESSLVVSLLMALCKLVLFAAFMLVVGKRILPWVLGIVAQTRSRELFTLSVFVVAVGVAFAAAHVFGISFALGAFFAGMVIKESDFSNEVTEKALPFQDAFAVLFFVSVGMLFNPAILLEQPLHVLIVVAIIMVGKSIAAFLIVVAFRYPARTGLKISACLGQIGEFSFVLGTLGLSYGLLSEEANSLILAGALISITLNPFTFKVVDAIYAHPRFAALMDKEKATDKLARLTGQERQELKDLVILVGYGRVGRHFRKNMEKAKLDLVVIDHNRELVEQLRSEGVHALAGDATFSDTLREAAIDKARAVVVAVPNAHEARAVVAAARALKPSVEILVRAHNDEEKNYFEDEKADFVVVGVQEVAHRMLNYLEQKYLRAKGGH